MRRLILTAALSPLLVPTAAHAGCQTDSCVQRVARKQCSQTRVLPCIRRAAMLHRVSYELLARRAWCESRFDPYAANSAHAGLFQFRVAPPSTWETVPWRYSRHSPYSAKWSSLAAAWMQRVGRGREWACQ